MAVTHRMSKTRQYVSYHEAKKRCENKRKWSYKWYGGRGIKFEWKNFDDFWKDMGDSFFEHVSVHGEKNTTLDRIDRDGNYNKENCRWSTIKEQCNNRSSNHYLEYEGEIYTIATASEKFGINRGTLLSRMKRGMSVSEAIEKPLRKNIGGKYVYS